MKHVLKAKLKQICFAFCNNKIKCVFSFAYQDANFESRLHSWDSHSVLTLKIHQPILGPFGESKVHGLMVFGGLPPLHLVLITSSPSSNAKKVSPPKSQKALMVNVPFWPGPVDPPGGRLRELLCPTVPCGTKWNKFQKSFDGRPHLFFPSG